MSLRSRVALVFLFSGLWWLANSASCAAKVSRHDTVIMKNGDRLTGEVKRLQEGVLYIQTDYFSGSVGVDWLQVEKVESKATFQIVLSNGKRLTGSISKVEATAAPGKDVIVHAEGLEVPIAGGEVVEIESQKQNFWRQLKGSIDLGYNYTSGNSQSSLNSSASVEYPSAKWAAGASYTASFSGQSGRHYHQLVRSAVVRRALSESQFLFGWTFRFSAQLGTGSGVAHYTRRRRTDVTLSETIKILSVGLLVRISQRRIINPDSRNPRSEMRRCCWELNINCFISIATHCNPRLWCFPVYRILDAFALPPRMFSRSSCLTIST